MINRTNRIDDTLLHQDHQTLFFLQEEASIGLWEVALESQEIYWSDVTKSIHETSENYVPSLGNAIGFYKEGVHRKRITRLFQDAVENGIKFDDEFIIITCQGREKWVRSVGVPTFRDGKCVRVHGIFQDIDIRKKAEIELKLSEQRFRQTFQNAPNGIALVGLDGSWLRVNARISEILGYTETELLALNFQKLTYPSDLGKDLKLLSNLLKGKIDTYQIEKRYINKQGNIVWCLLSVSLVRKETGAPLYFISQLNEITKLKKANSIITELLEETKSQNEKLLNFKHIVSHNLKSHTSNLDMLFSFLKQDMPEIENVEVFKLLTNAFENLQETIINLSDISDFGNTSENDFESICVKDEINSNIYSVKALVKDIKGTIVNKISNEVKVSVIPEYLRSIFLNLLTNAIKYRKNCTPLLLEINAFEEDNYTVICFKDNGIGINLKLHGNKLFGMYKTFHKNEDSRGLGLFIVKSQIEAMGGKITVESKVNEGSSFKVYVKK